MQFVYVDAGLRNEIGHHANCCRAVMRELNRRGIANSVAGYAGVEEPLRAELNIAPLLRAYIYYLSDGDPLAGWLNAFEQVSHATRQDLARLSNIGANDIVYVASAYPGQLLGVGQWLGDLAPNRRPYVFVELLGHPGVEIKTVPEGLVVLPRREDPRAMLYRYAANRIAALNLAHLTISYADPVAADIFAKVLNREVTSLPLPFDANPSGRDRSNARHIRLGVLGSQRNEEKGYHLLPEILPALLQSYPALAVHVHNSYPGNFPKAHEAMRALAASEPRIVLDERAMDAARWAELLDATDLMLCPYRPDAYRFMTSGIHAEAIANAIPAVVPADTALSRALDSFGGGETFDRFEPASIVEACRRVLNRFDAHAAKAYAGAAMWGQTHGAGKLVDAILGSVQKRS